MIEVLQRPLEPKALLALFWVGVNTSGMSIGYSIPAALFGGGAPFIATLLIAQTDILVSAAFFLIVTAVVGITAALFLKETDLHQDTKLASKAHPELVSMRRLG
ncbi:hypothetical protein RCH23_003313 [Cryobacterium sp. CAN_C3]|uniref:hypothetical protein n=1 Tax=unclassified Cryobacterium TaxID=2649013 RepID=UPI0018C91954|nr:hypothetical protein [Cryobacterium sp. CAN_C3]MEC5155910.1 hypothetical protein [Cryobacterium sp. CAN_C3]